MQYVSPFWIKSANSALMNFEAGTFNFQLGSTFKINLYLFPRAVFLFPALLPLSHLWKNKAWAMEKGSLLSLSLLIDI